ncbi:MAG: lipoate--protein ligase family protein [Chlamydiales bacterium]
MTHEKLSESSFHLLNLDHHSILEQLKIEEALLRCDDRNWIIINSGSHPAIVMGISGKIEELIHLENYRHFSFPIIRRFSGGGTVVVDENTCFISVICNQEAIDIPPFPQTILQWNGQLLRPVIGKHFSVCENDYVIKNKKIGGNAQYLTKKRWLHHSTLLWDFCPKKMDTLLMPPKFPKYRLNRTHHDFLCTLKSTFSTKKDFIEGLVNHLHKKFNLKITENDEIASLLRHPHRKATRIEKILP